MKAVPAEHLQAVRGGDPAVVSEEGLDDGRQQSHLVGRVAPHGFIRVAHSRSSPCAALSLKHLSWRHDRRNSLLQHLCKASLMPRLQQPLRRGRHPARLGAKTHTWRFNISSSAAQGQASTTQPTFPSMTGANREKLVAGRICQLSYPPVTAEDSPRCPASTDCPVS